jgi:ceramide glucosyltransferase
VTIIRPLLGLDPNLFYNLQSTLALEYPPDKLEIIFAVQDPKDPAVGVVKLLLDERVGGDPTGPRRWDHLDAKVVVNPDIIGTNPKINNLVKPFKDAKFEILWVVDATVSLTSSMLARSVEALITPISTASPGRSMTEGDALLDEHREIDSVSYRHTAEYSGIGIVHHLPNAWVPNTTGKGTFGSRLEACYLNGVHGRMYLAIVSPVRVIRFPTRTLLIPRSRLSRSPSRTLPV